MRQAHTVQQVRAAEAEALAALPEGALMHRAAYGLAVAAAQFLAGQVLGTRILLLVGSGDNGGDALFAGAYLARRGAKVEALKCADRMHQFGATALKQAGGRLLDELPATAPDLVIDGIVGIGGTGGLRPRDAATASQLRGVPTIACDTPSGVDVDSGEINGQHIRADLTVTFGTYKVCHLVEPAAEACGVVELVDIGLGLPEAQVSALTTDAVAALIPRPGAFAHKYTRGVVGVRAGSGTYPGAGVLCVSGANSGLGGMVRYVGGAADDVRRAHPEVVGEGQVQAWVVGSGTAEDAAKHLQQARADAVPLVVDADALNEVTGGLGVPTILTPHAGELARMLDTDRERIEARLLHYARQAAARFEAVVVLKGRHTLIADPSGKVRVTTTGNPWLATAGAGDVLAGLTGALLAAGLPAFDAASVGSWVHGAAATLAGGRGPITASDVAAGIAAVVHSLITA